MVTATCRQPKGKISIYFQDYWVGIRKRRKQRISKTSTQTHAQNHKKYPKMGPKIDPRSMKNIARAPETPQVRFGNVWGRHSGANMAPTP